MRGQKAGLTCLVSSMLRGSEKEQKLKKALPAFECVAFGMVPPGDTQFWRLGLGLRMQSLPQPGAGAQGRLSL